MKILEVRNVHEALPFALQLLDREGVERGSRNGPVLHGPSVTTIYERPYEKIVFYPERDSNIFFLLYEALWMLAGREDLAPIRRYVSTFGNYSDDGITLNGAYGYRWKYFFEKDQLEIICRRLKINSDDRRCVLQMWDAQNDLDSCSKDIPCNLMATFQIGHDGRLDMTVFCRSNDILWGAYFANAFHFGMLLEYMAHNINRPVGTYSQISVNWHGYLDTLKSVTTLRPDKVNYVKNPYSSGLVETIGFSGSMEQVNDLIFQLLLEADSDFDTKRFPPDAKWARTIYFVLKAHHLYSSLDAPLKFSESIQLLQTECDPKIDYVVAAVNWIQKRYNTWILKNTILDGGLEHP